MSAEEDEHRRLFAEAGIVQKPPEELVSLDEDPFYQSLLSRNRKWASEQLTADPEYFHRLQAKQTPKVFWIGCSDSRVGPEILLQTQPGEVFTYRNVANMCLHTDMAFLSTLDYAVTHLGVHHIIVCGHYNCGGIAAAMAEPRYGLVDNWIRHIKDVYRLHFRELDRLKTHDSRFRRFVELNVHEQVLDVAKSSVVQRAWEKNQDVHVHGWVFDIFSGNVVDLACSVRSNESLPKAYDFGSELVDWRFSEHIAKAEGLPVPEARTPEPSDRHITYIDDHAITPPTKRRIFTPVRPGSPSFP